MRNQGEIVQGMEEMAPGPVLRILLYVDDRRFLCDYTTRALQSALMGGMVNVHVELVARPRGARLTAALLEDYDEVWFFLRVWKHGEPLTEDEIAALHEWMNRGGGVLLAGDHAEKPVDNYLGIGGVVGRCIPRARHLRVWDASPGTNSLTAADTTEFVEAGRKADALELERDALPQRLLLPVQANLEPHAIFREGLYGILDRFPDHRHEGEVKVDRLMDPVGPLIASEWPDLSEANQPTVIAKSVNWRIGRTHGLMAQWDGHRIASGDTTVYGRILADSSFHHYVDDNLTAIAEARGEHWAKISALFRNQAAWLAPLTIKQAYRERALDWTRRQPCLQEIPLSNLPDRRLVANRLLAKVLPGAWFHEFIDDLLLELGARAIRWRLSTPSGPILSPQR
jgi:hypothetical protein